MKFETDWSAIPVQLNDDHIDRHLRRPRQVDLVC